MLKLKLLLFIADLALVNVSFVLALLARYGGIPDRGALGLSAYIDGWWAFSAMFILTFAFCGVFKERFRSSWELFQSVSHGVFWGVLSSSMAIYAMREGWGFLPTGVLLLLLPISVSLVFVANKTILARFKHIGRRVAVLGNGGIGAAAEREEVVVRIEVDELPEKISALRVADTILITEEITNPKLVEDIHLLSRRLNIEILYAPMLYLRLVRNHFSGLNSEFALQTFAGQLRDSEETLIRAVDLIGASLGILILALSFPIMVTMVKFKSPGSVFYSQPRVGKDGKVFTIYKFRTMRQDAETTDGLRPAVPGDDRISFFGKFLRRSRLDETPQCLNVLKGEMSLVGPRPENLDRVAQHQALQGLRLAVKPGLTGLAQVRSYYDLKPVHKIKYDYLYIQRRSLALNLYIITLTIPAIFGKKGW